MSGPTVSCVGSAPALRNPALRNQDAPSRRRPDVLGVVASRFKQEVLSVWRPGPVRLLRWLVPVRQYRVQTLPVGRNLPQGRSALVGVSDREAQAAAIGRKSRRKRNSRHGDEFPRHRFRPHCTRTNLTSWHTRCVGHRVPTWLRGRGCFPRAAPTLPGVATPKPATLSPNPPPRLSTAIPNGPGRNHRCRRSAVRLVRVLFLHPRSKPA